jgi:outer membrane protein W
VDRAFDFNLITLGRCSTRPLARVRLYAGPAIAYIEYDDAKFNVNGVQVKVRVDNETTWDVRAGIDVKPLKWLGIGASIEYIDASADFDAGGGNDGTLDPKPIVTKLGASLRF